MFKSPFSSGSLVHLCCWQWIVPTVEVATPRLGGKLFSHSFQDDVLATEEVWTAGVGISHIVRKYRNSISVWLVVHQSSRILPALSARTDFALAAFAQ